MKKKFKDRLIPSLFISIFKGAIKDPISPFKGAIVAVGKDIAERVKSPLKGNIESQAGGFGKVDWVRLIAMLSMLGFLTWGIYTGSIQENTAEFIIEMWESVMQE